MKIKQKLEGYTFRAKQTGSIEIWVLPVDLSRCEYGEHKTKLTLWKETTQNVSPATFIFKLEHTFAQELRIHLNLFACRPTEPILT